LCFEINELIKKNINIEIIALQETWDVKYPDLFPITGFNPLICKRRRGMRGGGVGFYVKEGLRAEILENLSPFENKIIEALTIQLSYPSSNKKILLTSLYRSNGIIANVTQGQQIERFFEKFSIITYCPTSKPPTKLCSYLQIRTSTYLSFTKPKFRII
jgi:hypothetical protein